MVGTSTEAKTAKPAAPPAAKWVSFLRQYGPLPQNGNQYDEDIQKTSRRIKLPPLSLATPALETILAALNATPPRHVVVTGTAGDGKTYHCREVWTRLGGTASAWEDIQKVKTLKQGDRELVVIRDFSEIHRQEHPDERDKLLQEMAEQFLAPNPSRVFLVAANDGQLLEQWKAASRSKEVATVHAAIEDLLVLGTTKHEDVRLELVNLSRQSANAMLPQVFDAILHHPGWNLCAECPMRQPADGPRCPIYENKSRLAGDGQDQLLRDRLSQVMELCDRNRTHFPVRQLFLLVANTLLGHPDSEHGLMSCSDVAKIQKEGIADKASVYRNVFGENLKGRRRHTTPIFDLLARFGIGSETSNQLDAVLVYGTDDPELVPPFQKYVVNDPLYGASQRFLALQRAYLEGGDDGEKTAFLKALRAQRQRLFFTLPPDMVHAFNLWDLTVFRYAGEYLDTVKKLLAKQPVSRSIIQHLVKGLNRVSTGILLNNHDELFLASSGSHSSAKISRLLEERIQVASKLGEGVTLSADGNAVFLVTSVGNVPGVLPARVELTLLRFEFLRRVADGALPSSFSLECYEDFLAYKATVLKAVEARRRHFQGDAAGGDELVLQFMKIGDDGRAAPEHVEVKL